MSSDVDINLLHLKLNALEERVKVLENTTKQLLPDDFYQARPGPTTRPLINKEYDGEYPLLKGYVCTIDENPYKDIM